MPTNEALSNDEFSKEQPLLFRKIQSAVDVMRQLENAYKNYDERNDNQWTIVILALGKSAIYQLERSLEVLKEHKIFNGWVAEARGVVLDCLQPLKVGPKNTLNEDCSTKHLPIKFLKSEIKLLWHFFKRVGFQKL